MSLLTELQKARNLFAQCPECGEEFPLSKASLFDATQPLPPDALDHLAEQQDELRQQRADLKKRKHQATTRPATGAASSRTGKVLEKIAPSLPGFPVSPGDCRALFEPIDYIVFKGLAETGKVDALIFVDVKSGDARLASVQRDIRRLVENQRITLRVIPPAKEVA